MKQSEFVRKLKKAGCVLKEHGKKHDRWYSPITGRCDQVPRHATEELPTGLVKALSKTLLGL